MKKLNNQGFGAIEIVLILVIIIVLGFVGYTAYQTYKASNNPSNESAINKNTQEDNYKTVTQDGVAFSIPKTWAKNKEISNGPFTFYTSPDFKEGGASDNTEEGYAFTLNIVGTDPEYTIGDIDNELNNSKTAIPPSTVSNIRKITVDGVEARRYVTAYEGVLECTTWLNNEARHDLCYRYPASEDNKADYVDTKHLKDFDKAISSLTSE